MPLNGRTEQPCFQQIYEIRDPQPRIGERRAAYSIIKHGELSLSDELLVRITRFDSSHLGHCRNGMHDDAGSELGLSLKVAA